jgi:hypothetical protein
LTALDSLAKLLDALAANVASRVWRGLEDHLICSPWD